VAQGEPSERGELINCSRSPDELVSRISLGGAGGFNRRGTSHHARIGGGYPLLRIDAARRRGRNSRERSPELGQARATKFMSTHGLTEELQHDGGGLTW